MPDSLKISSADPSVVILAGGQGTRIRHLLGDVPKPMAPVAGRPFLEWVLRFYRAHGLRRFYISSGFLSDVVEDYVLGLRPKRTEITVVRESGPLGTGGGFLNAASIVTPDDAGWLVVNGDSLLLSDPWLLFRDPKNDLWKAAILGLRCTDTSRYGSLEIDAANRLLAFAEKRPGVGLINGGVYWFHRDLPASFSAARPLSLERDVFPRILAEGVPIGVVPVTAAFLDIGIPATLSQAGAFIAENSAMFDFDL